MYILNEWYCAEGVCMYTLGINAVYHDSSACLVEANIRLVDVEHVAYSYDPFLLLGRHRDEATITLPLEPSTHPTLAEWESAWDPLFLSSIVNAPRHLAGGAPHHL